jgi:hypothetical protein
MAPQLWNSHWKRSQQLQVRMLFIRPFRRNAENRHARGREQGKGSAMRTWRRAYALYSGYKNAGVVFGDRFRNGLSRIAILNKAMHGSLAQQPSRTPIERVVATGREIHSEILRLAGGVHTSRSFSGCANVQHQQRPVKSDG